MSEEGDSQSRADRLRSRRNRSRRQSKQDETSETSESEKQSETDEPSETEKQSETSEPSKPSEQSQTDKPSKPSKQPQTDKTDETSKSKEGTGTASSVKDEQVGTYMYLPESLTEELAYQFKIQGAEYERETGEGFEKNRHWYPLVISLGLEQVKEMDSEELRTELKELN